MVRGEYTDPAEPSRAAGGGAGTDAGAGSVGTDNMADADDLADAGNLAHADAPGDAKGSAGASGVPGTGPEHRGAGQWHAADDTADPRIAELRRAVRRMRRELAAYPAELSDRAVADDELAALETLAAAGAPEMSQLRHSLLLIAGAVGSVSALATALAEVRNAIQLFGEPPQRGSGRATRRTDSIKPWGRSPDPWEQSRGQPQEIPREPWEQQPPPEPWCRGRPDRPQDLWGQQPWPRSREPWGPGRR